MRTTPFTSTHLVAALTIASLIGCSTDDTAGGGGGAGKGGNSTTSGPTTGGPTTSVTTSATTTTTMGTGGASTTTGAGGTATTGAGGTTTTGTGTGGAGGIDASTDGGTTGGGGNGGGSPDGGGDASDGAGGSGGSGGGGIDASDANGGPQAETAVILIDDVFVVQKDLDASTDAGSTGASYAFDADVQGWHYTPYGSSPNIGAADPGGADRAKLSDPSQSQLAFDASNDADGRTDESGALKITVSFLAANDQIDAQAFSVQPNDATQWKVWSGFRGSAKIKLVSGGNLNPACPLKAWLYVTTGTNYATGLSPVVDLPRGMTDWATITFDLDAVNPVAGTPDPTQVNQLGIQITTGTCN